MQRNISSSNSRNDRTRINWNPWAMTMIKFNRIENYKIFLPNLRSILFLKLCKTYQKFKSVCSFVLMEDLQVIFYYLTWIVEHCHYNLIACTLKFLFPSLPKFLYKNGKNSKFHSFRSLLKRHLYPLSWTIFLPVFRRFYDLVPAFSFVKVLQKLNIIYNFRKCLMRMMSKIYLVTKA